jgi:hypothetical protein
LFGFVGKNPTDAIRLVIFLRYKTCILKFCDSDSPDVAAARVIVVRPWRRLSRSIASSRLTRRASSNMLRVTSASGMIFCRLTPTDIGDLIGGFHNARKMLTKRPVRWHGRKIGPPRPIRLAGAQHMHPEPLRVIAFMAHALGGFFSSIRNTTAVAPSRVRNSGARTCCARSESV